MLIFFYKDYKELLLIKKKTYLCRVNGEFEDLEITPYSSPPDLPDVMKTQEANGQEQIA